MISLRELGYRLPRWEEDNGGLVNAVTGQRSVPDSSRGNFVDAATGEAVGPGWRVWIGTANFRLIFTDPAIREPFLKIFAWNVVFALLSVATTFVIGVCLASLLQWKALRGRAIYRTLLILPYAIPAFIPILVFRGLFNEGYGEINHVLTALFGIAPKWFTDPMLARTMILIVNAWLGYPYMMIISSGMLQAVPDELYEATAVDGAGPWTNFTKVTLPQIFPPLFPLLIASFAFNFNNFSLIYLLTGGKPDITGSATVAGTTDLLVSYTFRMAFKDSSALWFCVRRGDAVVHHCCYFGVVAVAVEPRARRERSALMVEGRAFRGRLILAHVFLVAFIALMMVPLFMVVSISLRKGNFATGGILPTPETFSLEHWRMVLGLPVQQADGTWLKPTVSVLRWFGNSVRISAISAALILALSATAPMLLRGCVLPAAPDC